MYCRTPSNAEGQSAEFELRFKFSGPDLIAAWPMLPKPIRRAMLALIDCADCLRHARGATDSSPLVASSRLPCLFIRGWRPRFREKAQALGLQPHFVSGHRGSRNSTPQRHATTRLSACRISRTFV
jgi:hypothetical protein